MFRMFILLMLVSCGKVENGRDGINGMSGENGLAGNDGQDYYSYMLPVSIQEIIGDGRTELVEITESNIYQLPKTFDVTVDNQYPECELQEFHLIVESDTEQYLFTFKPTSDRYKMELKDGPINKVVDSSKLRVYYKDRPEVDCGSVVYRLHSGVSFNIRVIQKLEID